MKKCNIAVIINITKIFYDFINFSNISANTKNDLYCFSCSASGYIKRGFTKHQKIK